MMARRHWQTDQRTTSVFSYLKGPKPGQTWRQLKLLRQLKSWNNAPLQRPCQPAPQPTQKHWRRWPHEHPWCDQQKWSPGPQLFQPGDEHPPQLHWLKISHVHGRARPGHGGYVPPTDGLVPFASEVWWRYNEKKFTVPLRTTTRNFSVPPPHQKILRASGTGLLKEE